MKPRVYLESTIPSYVAAWPSPDLVRSAHQQSTREWWAKWDAFELYTSRLVVLECGAGDPKAASDRLETLKSIQVLEQTRPTAPLARSLILKGSLPKRAEVDALHIAIAAIHSMDSLLTWNCSHIANVTLRPRIEAGFQPPLICTPLELPARR